MAEAFHRNPQEIIAAQRHESAQRDAEREEWRLERRALYFSIATLVGLVLALFPWGKL